MSQLRITHEQARTYMVGQQGLRQTAPLQGPEAVRAVLRQLRVIQLDPLDRVYKPAAKRRWGYYVCPLLHDGRLVGRFEGHREGDELVVDQLWREDGQRFDDAAWEACFARHQSQM